MTQPRGNLLIPTLSTAIMLAILIALGVWQIHRLAWKTAILAAIDHAEAAPPVPLTGHPGRFEKVSVTGAFRPDLRLLYGAEVRDTRNGPTMGAGLIQPLIPANGPPILIDRGWVPDQPNLPIFTPLGPVTLQGYVRAPEHPALFSAKDDPAQHRFYTLNPAAMGAALGIANVAPMTIILLGPASPGAPYPIPATALPRPPNDHLSYAITWFGLATVLAAIFTRWLLTQKHPPSPSADTPQTKTSPAPRGRG